MRNRDKCMDIMKRNGQRENYDAGKIKNVIRLAFLSVGKACGDQELDEITAAVEEKVICLLYTSRCV